MHIVRDAVVTLGNGLRKLFEKRLTIVNNFSISSVKQGLMFLTSYTDVIGDIR